MTDYDLPAEHQVAIRKAKKKTSLGGAILLLAIFLPLGVKIGFLKRHHVELERGDNLPEEPISPRALVGLGIAGGALGVAIIATGFVEESRAEKKAEAWRKNLSGAKR